MTGRYAKGHIRALRIPKGASHYRDIVGASIGAQADELLLPDVPADQTALSSCAGFGYYKIAEAWARANGVDVRPVSALAGYIGARSLSAHDPDAALIDNGSDPASVVDFAMRYGLLPESVRPYDEGRVNDRLSQYELEVAAEYGIARFAVLSATGSSLSAAIAESIQRRCPVAFAMIVTDEYESLKPGQIYSGSTSRRLGGHAQRLSGFRKNANGGLDFRVTGSWGPFFADDGFAWVSDKFIESDECFDLYAFQFATFGA